MFDLIRQNVISERYPERDNGLKPDEKRKAGGKIALNGQQRQSIPATNPVGANNEERKMTEMKNTVENSQLEAPAKKQSRPVHTEQLFDPQEWESLLNSFETEASSATTASQQKSENEIELSSDDLWERLSSTRWLRAKSDVSRTSTLTDKPAE